MTDQADSYHHTANPRKRSTHRRFSTPYVAGKKSSVGRPKTADGETQYFMFVLSSDFESAMDWLIGEFSKIIPRSEWRIMDGKVDGHQVTAIGINQISRFDFSAIQKKFETLPVGHIQIARPVPIDNLESFLNTPESLESLNIFERRQPLMAPYIHICTSLSAIFEPAIYAHSTPIMEFTAKDDMTYKLLPELKKYHPIISKTLKDAGFEREIDYTMSSLEGDGPLTFTFKKTSVEKKPELVQALLNNLKDYTPHL